MPETFKGASEVVGAYTEALSSTSTSALVRVEGCLDESAIQKIRSIAEARPISSRNQLLNEVLHNEMPRLGEAELLIQEWAKNTLPDVLTVLPGLKALVTARRGDTAAHTDAAVLTYSVINAPFAISIGTVGLRQFRGLRFPGIMDSNEILGHTSSPLENFERENTENDLITATSQPEEVYQFAGDIVLIQGSPRPTLHTVSVFGDVEAEAVISSYLATDLDESSAQELITSHLDAMEQ